MRTALILVFASACSRPAASVSPIEDTAPAVSTTHGAKPSQAAGRLLPPATPENLADPSQTAAQPTAPTSVNGDAPSQDAANQASTPQTPDQESATCPEHVKPQQAAPMPPLPAAKPVLEVFHWRALAEQYCTRLAECFPSENTPSPLPGLISMLSGEVARNFRDRNSIT